ncbi:hypothetical protein VNO77_24145 [Canavalia gladiata]|uniref:Uncharacterized protein n=1 Tax=Canavalia gladiata TaxID=3824 RepID=A0AAN9L885_CANGL
MLFDDRSHLCAKSEPHGIINRICWRNLNAAFDRGAEVVTVTVSNAELEKREKTNLLRYITFTDRDYKNRIRVSAPSLFRSVERMGRSPSNIARRWQGNLIRGIRFLGFRCSHSWRCCFSKTVPISVPNLSLAKSIIKHLRIFLV